MKLAIMQPYFFPYLGYFALMKNTDCWVSFDAIQYIDRGWVNRNRIIHPDRPEASYITIPLQKHSRSALINQVEINRENPYIARILGQLKASYQKRAPYYKAVNNLVEECLLSERVSLSRLNELSLRKTCEYLGFPVDFRVFSQMDLTLDPIKGPGDWALNISKAMGAKAYYNPTSGAPLFDEAAFAQNGIQLRFLKAEIKPYPQKKSVFLPSLSIIDVMMFNAPEEVNHMLQQYKLLTKSEAQ